VKDVPKELTLEKKASSYRDEEKKEEKKIEEIDFGMEFGEDDNNEQQEIQFGNLRTTEVEEMANDQ